MNLINKVFKRLEKRAATSTFDKSSPMRAQYATQAGSTADEKDFLKYRDKQIGPNAQSVTARQQAAKNVKPIADAIQSKYNARQKAAKNVKPIADAIQSKYNARQKATRPLGMTTSMAGRIRQAENARVKQTGNPAKMYPYAAQAPQVAGTSGKKYKQLYDREMAKIKQKDDEKKRKEAEKKQKAYDLDNTGSLTLGNAYPVTNNNTGSLTLGNAYPVTNNNTGSLTLGGTDPLNNNTTQAPVANNNKDAGSAKSVKKSTPNVPILDNIKASSQARRKEKLLKNTPPYTQYTNVTFVGSDGKIHTKRKVTDNPTERFGDWINYILNPNRDKITVSNNTLGSTTLK